MEWMCNRTFLMVLTVGVIVRCTVLVPATVEVCLGSNATINCSFQLNASHVIVSWFFNKTPDFSGSKMIEVHGRYHQDKGTTWSTLTIKQVMSNDSGWYFCKVTQDIPTLVQENSEGSQLIIIKTASMTTNNYSSSNSTSWLVWTASLLGCVALAIVVVAIWRIFCRKRDSPIYENTMTQAKKDRSPRPSISMEKSHLSKQTDPLKSHYTTHVKGRHLNP
ncbi:hypothetical protein NFI96_014508 [Prochilodus magdalenae]|nr:hypothetical protein NFI96_014508 [Prochilodus magdalenae]